MSGTYRCVTRHVSCRQLQVQQSLLDVCVTIRQCRCTVLLTKKMRLRAVSGAILLLGRESLATCCVRVSSLDRGWQCLPLIDSLRAEVRSLNRKPTHGWMSSFAQGLQRGQLMCRCAPLPQVEPFSRALESLRVDCMINGRRRDHGFDRAFLEVGSSTTAAAAHRAACSGPAEAPGPPQLVGQQPLAAVL
jgi:hypothetical protein